MEQSERSTTSDLCFTLQKALERVRQTPPRSTIHRQSQSSSPSVDSFSDSNKKRRLSFSAEEKSCDFQYQEQRAAIRLELRVAERDGSVSEASEVWMSTITQNLICLQLREKLRRLEDDYAVVLKSRYDKVMKKPEGAVEACVEESASKSE